MASPMSQESSAPAGTPPRNPRYRGRGNGYSQPREQNGDPDGQSRGGRNNRGPGRGRGRGRGRGDSYDRSFQPNFAQQAANSVQQAIDPGGISRERPAGDADATQGVAQGTEPAGAVSKGEEEEEVDAEVCFICASPVEHNAVAPCNHRTCHICSLRLRALYKTKACAHCRTQSDLVIFTDDPVKRFEDFQPSDFFRVDQNLGIEYEKQEIFEDTLLLLRYNCPDHECDVACLGWPDLHRHVKTVHQKSMCDLCTRNKKVFTHEHELFTKAELQKHERFGDDNPGAIDQTGFKGHPECGFCRRRFYGDDELYTHCREKHERCHICDRLNGGAKPQYYLNYDALETHFRKDHFMCPDRECLEKKFVVFGSEMDLKAHQIEAHPNGLTKDALRDARRVDMSGFNLREAYQPPAGRRGERRERDAPRGRGRGRDPNAEPLPQSSAQPLSRSEVAFQRQMAIQNTSGATARTFGGQLSGPSSDAFAARPPANAPAPAAVAAPRPTAPRNDFPSLGPVAAALESTTPRPSSPTGAPVQLTPQEQARRLRHNAVVERAANLLRGDQSKLAQFRNDISSYKNSTTSANGLIEGFFALFDAPSSEVGKLIKELADIFEIATKRDNLLKAYNDWRAINEDYPSLPGSSSVAAAPSTHGGKRVLKLKSSTAQSSRSAVGRAGSWGTAGSPNIFPTLSAAAGAKKTGGSRPTPWASTAASSSSSSTPRPVVSSAPARSVPRASAPTNNSTAFPALPVAAKPASTVFSPGYRGAGIRRDLGLSPAGMNPWSASAAAGSSNQDSESATNAGGANGQTKKGKQGKKQVLISWG